MILLPKLHHQTVLISLVFKLKDTEKDTGGALLLVKIITVIYKFQRPQQMRNDVPIQCTISGIFAEGKSMPLAQFIRNFFVEI